jgi:hypothetical protein
MEKALHFLKSASLLLFPLLSGLSFSFAHTILALLNLEVIPSCFSSLWDFVLKGVFYLVSFKSSQGLEFFSPFRIYWTTFILTLSVSAPVLKLTVVTSREVLFDILGIPSLPGPSHTLFLLSGYSHTDVPVQRKRPVHYSHSFKFLVFWVILLPLLQIQSWVLVLLSYFLCYSFV